MQRSLQLSSVMLAELRKRRTAQDAGLADAPEPPQIDRGGRRERIGLGRSNGVESKATTTPTAASESNATVKTEEKLESSKLGLGQYFAWDRPVGKTSIIVVLLLTILSLGTRFYHIGKGSFVIWDEAHFGKFASHYLRGTFYFDVHPPLGKMLVALGGKLAGYDGTFDFASGGDYGTKVNYVTMRMFVASFGAMIVPLAYMTCMQLRFSQPISILVALMMLFENGFIGITRLILLDSMLLAFTALTFFAYSWFRNQHHHPFQRKWKLSLVLTGIGIGCVSSVKWVGFFITALIGVLTIEELWCMLGDKNMPKVHFSTLNRSGPGDANMSSLFQAGLHGNDLSNAPIEVAYGSFLTLKSNTYGGGLLHSHIQRFPTGSKQQQVTTYHHKDGNNIWRIIHSYENQRGELIDYDAIDPKPVKNGDIIRLLHNNTGHFLHSHRIPAPINKKDYEVSSYGRVDLEDPNDLWQLEIVKDTRSGPSILRALTTRFRLKHVTTGCYLKSRNNQLPEWGFRQGEVSCDYTPEFGAKYLEWNVEQHINPKLPKGDASQYKSNFWDDLKDCNVGMYKTNNALVPDEELEPGMLTSQAWEWFFMMRGIRMCSWADDRIKFYMLGNPLVWWTGSVAIIATLSLVAAFKLIKQRGALNLLPENYGNFMYRVKMVTGAWAFTYLPFFIMGRVLYVHHYYPALIFSIMNVGLLADFWLGKRSQRTQWLVMLVMSAIVLGVFIYFSPLCYGITGPAKVFRLGRRWLKSWNL